jgi:uncharacterized protein YbjT (DUF2867 family)
MEGKTALVFGATGLVGSELVKLLLADSRYVKVKAFVRRDPAMSHPKLEIVMTEIPNVISYSQQLTGDELYICLGTTIKKAGSIKAMEIADRDTPASIASAARDNGVNSVAVVSSIGADDSSRNYYLRIKGEMEREVAGLGFNRTVIVRPSILLGERNESRFGEDIAKVLMKTFRFLFIGKFRKYRGIEACDVARAMVRLLNTLPKPEGIVFESNEL